MNALQRAHMKNIPMVLVNCFDLSTYSRKKILVDADKHELFKATLLMLGGVIREKVSYTDTGKSSFPVYLMRNKNGFVYVFAKQPVRRIIVNLPELVRIYRKHMGIMK
jgi:hypothetical protein